jgi:hypothetical protein
MKKIIVCMLFVFSYVICSSIGAAEVEDVEGVEGVEGPGVARRFVFAPIVGDGSFRDLGEAYRQAISNRSAVIMIKEDPSGIPFGDVCAAIETSGLPCSFNLPRRADLPIEAVLAFIDAVKCSPDIRLFGCPAVTDEHVEAMLNHGLGEFTSINVIGCPLSSDGIRELAHHMKPGSKLYLSTVPAADDILRTKLSDIAKYYNKGVVFTKASCALASAKGSTTESKKSALVQALEALGDWKAGTEVNKNTVRSAVKRYANRCNPKIEIGRPGVAKCFDLVHDELSTDFYHINAQYTYNNAASVAEIQTAFSEFYARDTSTIDFRALNEEGFPASFIKRDMHAIGGSLCYETTHAIQKLMKKFSDVKDQDFFYFWRDDRWLDLLLASK